MIKVNVEVDSKPWHNKLKDPKKYINKKLKKIYKSIPILKAKNITFTLLLTNSLKIKELNKKFRNINKATDVLSFPFFSPNRLKKLKEKNVYIGDIAICYEIINIRSKNTSFYMEFDKIWVHGLLHLIGFNHVKNKEYFIMNKFEKKILNLIS